MEKIKNYLIERLKTIEKAIEILPKDAFLKGEYLAFNSILTKLKNIEEEKKKDE